MEEAKLITSDDGENILDIFGVDEAGRGCLAGPVVATAVILKKTDDPKILTLIASFKDSKTLSEAQREALLPAIKSASLLIGYGLSWPKEIDTVNILNATFRAMSRAILQIQKQVPYNFEWPPLMVDGNINIREKEWWACTSVDELEWHKKSFPKSISKSNDKDRKDKRSKRPAPEELPSPDIIPFPFPYQKAIIEGDQKIKAISAASILAKSKRDYIMKNLDKIFPNYGFSKHKGYATKEHREMIQTLGSCSLHRLSFLKKIESKPKFEQGSLF